MCWVREPGFSTGSGMCLDIVSNCFKVKPQGLLQKYDEEIEGEQKQSFVLGKNEIECIVHRSKMEELIDGS